MLNEFLSVTAGGTRLCALVMTAYTAAIIFAAVMAIVAETPARRRAAARVLALLTRRSGCSCRPVSGGIAVSHGARASRRSTTRRSNGSTNR